jgi:mRNA-degrading endonuclease RelE of RelBE toxin-antitoxin system
MSYSIRTLPLFDKQIKRLVKKYPSLKEEYSSLLRTLSNDPTGGTSLGHNCFKIRLAISSKGKGKSGGARVITHVQFVDEVVYLLSIYDKSDMENIADNDLKDLIGQANDL